MVFEDFNMVLRYAEQKGGRIPNERAMEEFQNVVDSCDLVEVQYSGGKYTWCNNRLGSIELRLE